MTAAQPQLDIEVLAKSFHRNKGRDVRAVDNVSLRMEKGDFVVLLGPSGCGKTTLLRCVAGLESPDSGRISLGGETVYDSALGLEIPPERRNIGMVFQSYALWPHMTVAANIGYPLKMAGAGRAETDARVKRMLDMMRISELANQYPGQISGGQQQRVALARALARGDDMILFDEPLSNVDAKVREHLRLELLAMQRELGFAALYVTHDQEEAMSLATRIAVVADGVIHQIGTPQEVYRTPRNLKVAKFIGSANQLDGTVVNDGTGPAVETPLGRIALKEAALPSAVGSRVSLISRPERWRISMDRPHAAAAWPGKVRASAFLGPYNQYLVDLGETELQIWQQGSHPLPIGSEVWCQISADDLTAFVSDSAA
ncbi:MAG: hypothetical protein BGP06_09860 [Rhizobiales bacterium 65-9]|nr:ABC transporter ATP-binding protein [Hyphomicrobiales bacterium]OJY33203.1 MAG: hypothetical protein BGP06_09860 [Rhizobiales bacterium 65-9]